jgi:predicted ester cyclase
MKKYILIGMSLLLVVGLLAGCSGIKQEDLDAANAAKNAAQVQANTLQNEVNVLQTQVDAANATKGQVDANKALVVSYFQAQAKGDADALAQIFAPDYKRYLSAVAPPLDATAQMQRLAGLRAAFPDLKVTVDNIIVEGNLVTVKLTAEGTHQGALMGIAPTGKSVRVWAIEIIRIENGKFVEHWGGPDNLDLLQQIGAVISTGQ